MIGPSWKREKKKLLAQQNWNFFTGQALLKQIFPKNYQDSPIFHRFVSVKNISLLFHREVPGGLTPEEKQLVRDGLLNSLNEPVEQIASQLSVLTAKIARYY